MPRPRKGASDQEWDRHAARVKEIFFRNGGHDNADRPTLSHLREIMLRDHQFDAPIWQYELKLREWSLRRNVRQEDWVAIIRKLDELSRSSTTVRVMVSGQVVGEEKIKRLRRRAKKLEVSGKRIPTFNEWRSDPRSNYISIETLDHMGEWVPYPEQQPVATVATTVAVPHVTVDTRQLVLSSRTEFDTRSQFPLLDHVFQPSQSPPSFQLSEGSNIETLITSALPPTLHSSSVLPLTPTRLSPILGSSWYQSSLATEDNVLTEELQLQESIRSQSFELWSAGAVKSPSAQPLRTLSPALVLPATSPTLGSVNWENQQPSPQSIVVGIPESSLVLATPWSTSLRALVISLFRHTLSPTASAEPPDPLPHVDEVLDSLESLEALNLSAQSSNRIPPSIGEDATVTSKLQDAIFRSIVNGFASLPMLPAATVFQVARSQSGLPQQLFEYLRVAPLTMAKHLAFNLFRAAVEAGDAPSLNTIIDVMRSRGQTINPDDIVCEYNNRRLTPVELAVIHQNADIVHILIVNLKSDICKTHNPFSSHSDKTRHLESFPDLENPDIMYDLIRAGAEAYISTAVCVVKKYGRTHIRVVNEILRRLPSFSRCCRDWCVGFRPCRCKFGPLVLSIIDGCDAEFAMSSIRHLIEDYRGSIASSISVAIGLVENLGQAEEAGLVLSELATTTIRHIVEDFGPSRDSMTSLADLADALSQFLQAEAEGGNTPLFEIALTAIGRFVDDCKAYEYPMGFPSALATTLCGISTGAPQRGNFPICHFTRTTLRRLVEDYVSYAKSIDQSALGRMGPRISTSRPAESLASCLDAAAGRGDIPACEFLLDFTPVSHSALIAAMSTGAGNPVVDLFLRQGDIAKALQMPPSFARERQPTALAEAVRRRDFNLVAKLESCGAWEAVETDLRHFQQVLLAAIETDALDYTARLLRNERLKEWISNYAGDVFHVIFKAIQKNKTDAVLSLLEVITRPGWSWNNGLYWIDPRIETFRDRLECICLHLALEHQNEAIVDVLLELEVGFPGPSEVSPLYEFERRHNSVLLLAREWKGLSFVDELIHRGCPLEGALEEAVKADDLELVKLLLRWSAEPEIPGSLLGAAVVRGNEDMIQLLISEVEDTANNDAFCSAIGGNPEGLEFLIEAFRKMYPDGRIGFGADVLIAVLERDDLLLLRMLLHGARLDVNSRSCDKFYTPLGFAIQKHAGKGKEQVRLLIEGGADINAIAQWPSERPFDKKAVNHPQTSLQVAIRTRNLEMVDFLLSKGAKINTPARRGLNMTPLQTACKIGSYRIVQHLLNRGADVNQPAASSRGGTALQLAAISGCPRIVKLLLQWKADIHGAPSPYHGRTALQGAAEHGRIQIINILWDKANGFLEEEIKTAQKLAKENGNNTCAEHLTWLSDLSAKGVRLSSLLDLT